MPKKEELQQQRAQEEISRVKIPRGKEIIGVIDQRLGASRMYVRCFDGKKRICRVPGRMKRRLWVREGDIVLVEPWEYDSEKGDIIFKYRQTQIAWLKKNGYIKEVEDFKEF